MMIQSLFSTIQSFFTHPEFLVPTLWVAFGCTLAWYLLSAKKYHEITIHEIEMLWKTHKQFNNCRAGKFEPIHRGEKLVGYKCQCGHKHLQERPLIDFGTENT